MKILLRLAFQWERRWACHERGCFSLRQVLKCINISVLVPSLFSKGKFFTLSHGLKFLFLGVPKLASNITGLTQVCRTQPGLPQFSGSIECVIHHQMKQHKCHLSYLSFLCRRKIDTPFFGGIDSAGKWYRIGLEGPTSLERHCLEDQQTT